MSEQLPIEGEFRSGSSGERFTPGDSQRAAAIERLRPVVEAAGYWTPIGKVLESLVYADTADLVLRHEVAELARLILGSES